jgi:nitroimidazol reductase NimA-like FMN-containing flavoprotein (pyridoxamine 5'-phosphate oxidase superfamily)
VEPSDLEAIAREIVDSNRFMALGTADESGLPWVSPVWYAPADYRTFLWVSSPEARHSRNLASRPQVAIVIYDSHRPGGWTSVYMSAHAEQLDGEDAERGIEIFTGRSLEQGLREWTREHITPPAKHRLYRATATEQYVLTPGDRRERVDLA